jgi:replicative DNA helicase
MPKFRTGFAGLDRKIGHFGEQNLITVAGYRADETSIFVANMIRHMAFNLDARCLVLLPGQKPDLFEAHLRGSATGIPHAAFASEDGLSGDHQATFERYEEQRWSAKLTVHAPRALQLADLEDEIDQFGKQDLIVVDSVQMLDFAGPVLDEWGDVLFTETRIDQLGGASRALKLLASAQRATVIALCRVISRYTPSAEKAKALAEHSPDVFEAFHRDSDIVLEWYPKPNTGPQDTRRLVYIRKNRWEKDHAWVPLGLQLSTSTVTDDGSLGRGRR